MKLKLKSLAAAAMLALASFSAPAADVVFLTTPSCFQVLSVSPNGKWACGVFVDALGSGYGFRWNLESGKITMLSSQNTSMAWSVSNDGTVSGEFGDREVLPSGAPVNMVGYWQDGKWNHLEMPATGSISDGITGSISPDGRYISGSVCINGEYRPFIWEDGKISRTLNCPTQAVPYAISADGQMAGGWAYLTRSTPTPTDPNHTTTNRTACIWPADSDEPLFFLKSDEPSTPWAAVRAFSADGKTVLYNGVPQCDKHGSQWSADWTDPIYYCLYNMETGEESYIELPSINSTIEFNAISQNGLLAGADFGTAVFYKDGKFSDAEEYFASRGVNLRDFKGFYEGPDWNESSLPILHVLSMTPDESVFILYYAAQDSQFASLAVKVDTKPNTLPASEFSARQLDGLNSVMVSWVKPAGQRNRGYNIYRDGVKLNGSLPLSTTATEYVDNTGLVPGTYTYTIGTVPITGQEIMSEPVSVEISLPTPPYPLRAFARQKGVNNLYVTWDAPVSNLIHKAYYAEGSKLIDLSIYEALQVEGAVRFTASEMSSYADYQISEVSFYPMAKHNAWAINLYQVLEDGSYDLLYNQPITQELIYKARNTVKLDTPVELPEGKDIIVAIECSTNGVDYAVFGAQTDVVTVGYSDLLRRVDEDETFMSLFDSSTASTYYVSCLSFAIDMGLSPKNGEAATNVASYNLYLNDEFAGNTEETSFLIPNLEDGKYLFSVEAVYSDNQISQRAEAREVNVATNYVNVTRVNAAVSEEAPEVTFTWDTPCDNDAYSLTYTTARRHSYGLRGVASNGYAIMGAVLFDADMLRGLDGYEARSVRFYPLCNAIYTVYVYENDDMIVAQEVETYTINDWNEVILDEPFIINERSSYRVAIDVFDPEPEQNVLGIDAGPGISFNSDLYSLDNGETWSSFEADATLSANWMISLEVADPEGEELTVDGYDVRVDGVRRNTEMLQANTFTYGFEKFDNRRHSVYVDVYYPGKDKKVNGALNYFLLNDVSLDVNTVNEFVLQQGENRLIALGENVESITLYSVSGAVVGYAQGNSLEVSGTVPGIYIATVAINGRGTVSQKIAIR